jgi:hypothetical protein
MGVQSDLAEIMFSDFLTHPRICALLPVWPCHPLPQVQNREVRFMKEIMLIFHQGADQSTDILDQVKANTLKFNLVLKSNLVTWPISRREDPWTS